MKVKPLKIVGSAYPAAILKSDIGQRGLLIQRNTVTIRDAFETILEGT